MPILLYTLGVIALCVILSVFAYVNRIFRELGRVTHGRFHDHLETFEAEVEPRLKTSARARNALGFAIISELLFIAVAVEIVRGVLTFVPGAWEALAQLVVYLVLITLVCIHFVPELLLAHTTGRWLAPLVPAFRVALLITWPLRAVLELAISVAHISDEEAPPGGQAEQEGKIEALMEAAQEEGILAGDEAQLIEQVVEFSDKRVLELMTPRPDIVAIQASASIEQMRLLLIETKVSRVVIYDPSLDDVVGIAHVQDLLRIPESEASRRMVRELARPALFVPETKLGSELLKEMQRRNQEMAIAVDEHGLIAGVVTVEDLVEEIVGEMGKENNRLVPDVVRETDGSVVLRGSVSLDRVQELFGIDFAGATTEGPTTIAGLLNSLAGHVPMAGEQIDYDGLRFEVVEANQRKVLRLRVRPRVAATSAPQEGG